MKIVLFSDIHANMPAFEAVLESIDQHPTDILCFGHSHKPYHRILNTLDENKNHFRHAINIGSVGKPKDGDSRAGYVLLTIHECSNTTISESIDVASKMQFSSICSRPSSFNFRSISLYSHNVIGGSDVFL